MSTLIPDLTDNRYRIPLLDEKRFRREIDSLLVGCEERFAMVGGFSIFEQAWSLCSMEDLLVGILASPKELDYLLN